MEKWGLYLGITLLALIAALAVFWVVAHARYRPVVALAEAAFADLASRHTIAPAVFSPDMVADLPEIAQRYFNHAIAPDTPLFNQVELTMTGDFLLGEKGNQQTYAIQARQILAPPHEFVWIAQMSRGPFRISGSDGLFNRQSWTRFWMFRSLPLVQLAATPDLDRSAAVRPLLEAIWAPATLLPDKGVIWVQTGPETADVTFATGPHAQIISLRIGADGGVQEIWTQRWSDANSAKTYQLQPFGATIAAETTSAGFTVPSRVTVGNHFGTPAFLPFFIADITSLRYF